MMVSKQTLPRSTFLCLCRQWLRLSAVYYAAGSLIMPNLAYAITYDSTQNEYFETIEDYLSEGTENVGIRFGTTLQESFRFNRTTNMFETSKGLEVRGALSGETLNIEGVVGIGITPSNAKVHIKNGAAGQKFRIETNLSPYSTYIGGGMTGAQDEVGVNFGASLAAHLADTTSAAWSIEASGTNDYFAIKRGSNNGVGNAVTWAQLLRISDAGNVGIGLGSVNAETKLEVGGTISGTTLHANNELFSSGTLVTEGRSTFNGVAVFNEDASSTSHVRMEGGTNANLFFLDATNDRIGIGTSAPKAMLDIAGTLSGASLVISNLKNCDTIDTDVNGVLGCGVDAGGGGGGISQSDGDARYVRKAGGTITGALTIDIGSQGVSDNGTGLNVREKAVFQSGATLSGQLLIMNDGDPSVPPADSLYVYSKSVAGRSLLKAKGPSGIDYAFQPSLFQNSIAAWFPASGTTAGSIFGWAFTSAGTVSHPALASTNLLTQMRRTRWASATTANIAGGIFNNTTVTWRGNSGTLGGFFFFARFGQNVNTNGARSFVGLSAKTTHVVTAEPSAATDSVGMGYNAADASTGNWQLMYNDNTGTATKVDLGSSAPRDTTSVYDLFIFAAPSSNTVSVRIMNLSTNTLVYDGDLTTDIPTATTFLRVHAGNGPAATAVAQNFELNRLYLETDQ